MDKPTIVVPSVRVDWGNNAGGEIGVFVSQCNLPPSFVPAQYTDALIAELRDANDQSAVDRIIATAPSF